MSNGKQDLDADRRRALATVRRAYRDGRLTAEEAAALRAAGVDLDIYAHAPLQPGLNDLATLRPDLAAQWHPARNGDLRSCDVTTGSTTEVWWRHQMPDGTWHEWQRSINARTNKNVGCPYCAGSKVLPGFNDLAAANPNLAAEWHPTRNGDLKPCDVMPGTKRKVWWRCEKGHEWQAVVYSRMSGNGCPYCGNKKVLPGFNDLATVAPALAAEWHPTRNGELTPCDVMLRSNKKVWWLCPICGGEWEAFVNNRSK